MFFKKKARKAARRTARKRRLFAEPLENRMLLAGDVTISFSGGTQGVGDLYRAHLKECRDCRKMHRLLYALYEGPVVPPPPAGSGLAPYLAPK